MVFFACRDFRWSSISSHGTPFLYQSGMGGPGLYEFIK